MAWFMGIDIGSGTSKGVIIEDGKPQAYHLLPSGMNYKETGKKLRKEMLTKAGLSPKDISYTIATGSGADRIPFCDERVADIRCCARGINSIFSSVRTVIDIQGMTTQVIKINE
ncbi:MAG: 2-hydroxyglutaryl-CoA dehydratase, partial [Chloroflexi bacterium]|nr:2-hydroxyglutaryl-CoA dehydratase [Chloroflexota bacterium]